MSLFCDQTMFIELEQYQLTLPIHVSDVYWECGKLFPHYNTTVVSSLPEVTLRRFYGDIMDRSRYLIRIEERHYKLMATVLVRGEEPVTCHGEDLFSLLETVKMLIELP